MKWKLQLLSLLLISFEAAAVLNPQPLTKFSYQLQGKVVKHSEASVYFLDLFDTSTSTIKNLQNSGNKVVCYFSAGSGEDWRSDYKKIPTEALGKKLEGWDGERWLDVRNAGVISVMNERIKLASTKGCNGVDADNVDGYYGQTGFPLKQSDIISYLKKLNTEAQKYGLSLGMKNGSEIASSVSSFLSWAVVEECAAYKECGSFKPFIDKNKAVFRIEYTKYSSSECSKAKKAKMSLIYGSYSLDGKHKSCP